MNIFEFFHRESKLLLQYHQEEGNMNHNMYMEARRKLFERMEKWLDKGFHLQTNADQGGLEEVRDCKT